MASNETDGPDSQPQSGSAEPHIPPLQLIGHSGLFDAQYYLTSYPDLAGIGTGALGHYHQHGWREGRKPNPYFDPHWYCAQNPDVDGDPLLHYVKCGEAEGRRPIAWFDPVWYRQTYPVPEGMLLLRHYLLNRHRSDISPMPEFDSAHYLTAYPDVAAAGLDPLEHYMVQGFREARRPFADFDPAFYRDRYLANDPNANPLLHYLAHRERPGVYAKMPDNEPSLPREVRRATRPGPFFETRKPLPPSAQRRARVLAYYLPQFHHVAQNDQWWGDGFTEWTNVARGLPRFVGHYQPRIPRDLGYYTLDNPEIMRRQAAMAREAGIEGFVFYFYWFNGTRLLESPLEMLLANPDIDLPFCLMWANENWSRRWDGSDDDVLIAQDFRAEDEPALIACLVRHFRDPRYIRIQGRPVLMVYRPGVIPECAASIARWRRLIVDACGADPIFVMSQSFGDDDPGKFGMDGAIEFPPHKVVGGLPTINPEMTFLDSEFTGQIFDYEQVVDNALAMVPPDFPLIRTAAPTWDNDARRQGAGLVMHGATPARYERWLSGLIEQARRIPFHGESVVCINAWNEWAEGAYLEPDQHFGSAFLNATARAITGFAQTASASRVILIGHDAFPAGAQMLLLNIGKTLKRVHGVDIAFVLLGHGALLDQYKAVANVDVFSMGDEKLRDHLETLSADGYADALVNTAASACVAPLLQEAGIGFVQLVHELPAIIASRNLAKPLTDSMALARHTVFPTETVLQRIRSALPAFPDNCIVQPQGLYKRVRFRQAARSDLRRQLGVAEDDRLIIGVGYGDMRKGIDIFLHLWRATESTRRTGPRTHLLWLGDIDPALREWLGAEFAQALASGRFHLPGRMPNVEDYLSAADMFALTSREDPCPSVIMEALACGLRCVAFDGSGGAIDILEDARSTLGVSDLGEGVPMADIGRMARRATALASRSLEDGVRARAALARRAERLFPFDPYVETLLDLAVPGRVRISVVVLSYNYARYLAARIASVFAQSYPVLEIVVLDDASHDDSVSVARATAEEWGRSIRVVEGKRGSGSVFAQWRRAVSEARGDWVWIAEADDLADPAFLDRLVGALNAAPDAVMAFCDSRAIDSDGRTVYESYKGYYATTAGSSLDRDGVHDGPAFVSTCLGERNLIMNASAALFRRDALAAALARCGDLETFHAAGDWRLYIELLNVPGTQVAYVAEPLNVHRRHDHSVTARQGREAHLTEITRVHEIVRLMIDSEEMQRRQAAYRAELATQFGLVTPENAHTPAETPPLAVEKRLPRRRTAAVSK